MKISASCRDILSTYIGEILGKEERLVTFWREISQSLVSCNGGHFALWKEEGLQLLTGVIPDVAKTSR